MRSKLAWKRITFFTVLALGCVLLATFLVSRPFFQFVPKSHAKKTPAYIYHFAVITPESDSFYWKSFERGAYSYARQNHIVLEFRSPRFTNVKEEEHFLEFAVLSKVDGIVTSVPEEEGFLPLIKQASDWGIPVVTLDSIANPPSKYTNYVGYDPFEFGVRAGEALRKACNGQAKIAVLIGPTRASNSCHKILQGLSSFLNRYPTMQISLVLDSENGMISAEEQTYNILMNHPEIDTILCTNAEDTEGATQVVIDLNRVNSTTIIGSGLTPEIARYIRRNVIYGTLSVDPAGVGSRAIATLQGLKEDVPMAIRTDISFIDAENLDTFVKDYMLSGTGAP
jgi:ribose transport system substrate-binding protein